MPTAPTAMIAEPSPRETASAQDDAQAAAPLVLPAATESANPLAAFPPRNEPFQFRQALETYYQATLRRGPIQTAVDLEGAIVWTQEYLRYRLSACNHLTAISKVLAQIDTGGSAAECGGSASFPPRNEPFDFRSNYLESKYRDGLRRAPTVTYVDIEGDIVWTTEYFRYRLSGCGHEDATAKTLFQVGGNVAPATCQTLFAVWTSANQGWSSIAVTINGRFAGTLTRFLEPGTASSCAPLDGARIVAEVSAGTVTVSARSERGVSWNYSPTVNNGQCFSFELTCTNRNCGPTPAPTPTPVPTPTPPPNAFYVWGGPNYAQYLGFFTCVFCREFSSDSINNEFGSYGSRFSSTSIRNQFSQYGSASSSYSACNEFASNPPRVYNSNRSVTYGELTLNRFRSAAINTLANWLVSDVCRH